MRYESIQIVGFGRLSNSYRFPHDKLILVMEKNEAGKSTLANALLFGIYGLPDSRGSSRELFQRLQLLKPWSEHPFEIALDFTTSNQRLRIKRNFTTRFVQVLDLDTNQDVTTEFFPGKKDDLGNMLFKMSLMDAFKTLFVQQSQIVLENGSLNSLAILIQRIVDSNAGDSNVVQALNALQKSLNNYPFTIISKNASIDYEIQKLDDEIARCQKELSNLEKVYAAYHADIQRTEEILSELEFLKQTEKLLQQRSLIREKNELMLRIEEYQKLYSELTLIENRIRELEYYSRIDLSLEEPFKRVHTLLASKRRDIDKLNLHIELLRDQIETKRSQLNQHKFSRATIHQRDHLSAMKYSGESAFINARQAETSFRNAHSALQQKGIAEPVTFIEDEEKWNSLSPEEELLIAQLEKGQIGTTIALRKREAQDELKSIEDKLLDIDVLYRTKIKQAKIVRLVGIFLGLVGIGGIIGSQSILLAISISILLLGIFLAIFSSMRISQLPNEAEQQKIPLQSLLTKASENFRIAEEEYLAVHEKLRNLLNSLNMNGYKELYSEWRLRRELRREIEEWKRSYNEYHRNAKILNDIQEEAARILTEAGVPTKPTEISLQFMSESIDSINQSLLLQREIEEGERKIVDATKQKENALEEVNKLEKELWEILRHASIPHGLSETDAVQWFYNTIQKRREYDQYSQEKQRLSERLVPAQQYQEWQHRYEQLKNAVGELTDVEIPSPYNAMNDNDGLVSINQRRKELLEESRNLEIRLDTFQREWQHKQSLEERLQEVEFAKREALRFKNAVVKAIEEIDNISKDLHKNWSKALNSGTSQRLAQFGEPRFVTFSDQLELTVEIPNTKTLRDQELIAFSAGARDQLYLAVRLALVEYLSPKNDPLPVILDEPFAQCDDVRFDRGMHLLLDESKNRQILLFTCPEQRHQHWLDTHPE
ncbi:MAG: AAA family ATPase [bacterium]|nr:AAA family ATPase [bacterium]